MTTHIPFEVTLRDWEWSITNTLLECGRHECWTCPYHLMCDRLGQFVHIMGKLHIGIVMERK